MTWRATKAKAQFSALLDAVETEGPQLVSRRNQRFVVTTQEEIERRLEEARQGKRKSFISAWEALRPPFDERFDIDFPRLHWKPRAVDLG